jgi:ERCC4-type nuclease
MGKLLRKMGEEKHRRINRKRKKQLKKYREKQKNILEILPIQI